jgi:RNA polymerase sigma-70 factor (ECF subfamily)
MEKTDQQLITGHLDGDEKNFPELLQKYLKPVYAFVYQITRDRAMSDDIVQETFVKVWKNLKKYSPEYSFKTWLYTIAHNTTLDWLKKKRSATFSDFENETGENSFTESLIDGSLLPDELFIQKENVIMFEKAFEKMPALYREILTLHYHQELSFIEISTIINRPLETIRSQHRRGLLALQNILQKEDAPKD